MKLGVMFVAVGLAACVPVPPGLPPKDAEPALVPAESSNQPSPEDRAKTRREAEERRLKGSDEKFQQPANGMDPMNGHFTLEEATKSLPGNGKLVAEIDTSEGKLECQLFDDKAPNTVANFIGLANGIRPFKSNLDNRWVKQPYYDGTTFHRIIKGFMIQGGDQNGNGTGEPGYTIPDEMWGGKHDRAGLLCMANRGPNTNGAQFFITDAAAPWLDKTYTIFGVCSPTSIVHTIANMQKDANDRPLTAVGIDRVVVKREGT